MKIRELKRHVAGDILPSAHPSPGELAKVTPTDIAGAESAESPDSDESKAKQRRFAGLFAALAAVMLFAGDEFYAMFLAAFALYSALMGESRWRVPKLLRFLAAAVVVVLGVVKIVLWILETRGR